MRNMFKKLSSQCGIAVDEAVLATIMVASLGAFVFVNVPWEGMFGKTERLMTSLEQIEQANAEFFVRHRLWPHQTTTGDWKMNVSALVSPEAMRYPYNTMTSFKNYISDFSPKYSKNGVRHDFGEGGVVLQRPVHVHGEDFIQIIMENVPAEEARKLDTRIDNMYDPERGRITLKFSDEMDSATVYYQANRLEGQNI